MNCRSVTEDASAYLDGELARDRAAQIRSHLAECRSCAEEYRTLEQAGALAVGNIRTLDLPPALWNRVQTRIAAMPAPDEHRSLFRLLFGSPGRLAAAAAVLVLAVGAGLYGLLEYQHSRRALESYMSDYIQARQVTEETHRKPAIAPPRPPGRQTVVRSSHVEFSENPFVDTNSSPEPENPFRTEGQ